LSQPKPQLNMDQTKIIRFALLGFLALLLFTVLSRSTFVTIGPGQKGVKFKRFGGGLEMEKTYDEGFKVIAPWNTMYIYDVRVQEAFEKMEVLSKNGLTISVELSFLYHPVKDKVGYLHGEVGTNYLERILRPEIRSATREVIGKYLPEDLYSTQREAIQDEIEKRTRESVGKRYVNLNKVLIREVQLPETLKQAIEQKLEEEQLAFQFDFKLDRERKEAERKIIEAEAKATANKILNASLTDKILQDKGIEATLELANSPNSKVIIVGGGDEGLPLILNN